MALYSCKMGDSDATFMDNTRTAIRMTINGQEIQLRIDDCIKVKRDYGNGDDNVVKITGKIIRFLFSGPNGQPNRIQYLPWRGNRWSAGPIGATVGLRGGYLGTDGIDWSSIEKIACPDGAGEAPGAMAAPTIHGGKRRKHRATKKKARRIRRLRHSRKH